MKKQYLLLVIFAVLAASSGCVITATPDPSKQVTINTGEEVVLNIVCSNFLGLVGYRWNVFEDGEALNPVLNTDGPNKNRQYTFATEIPGRYKIMGTAIHYVISKDVPPIVLFKEVSRESREWDVIVKGVRISPLKRNLVLYGSPNEFKATAYPEGNYSYEWKLDGNIVSSSDTCNISPGLSDSGWRRLEVRAVSESAQFSAFREIHPAKLLAGSSKIAGIDTTGHLAVNGGRLIKYDLQGSIVWEYTNAEIDLSRYGSIIKSTPDGGCIFLGSDIDFNYRLGKIDGTGQLKWETGMLEVSDPSLNDIIPASDGGIIAVGKAGNTINSYYKEGMVIKIGPAGSIEWTSMLGDINSHDVILAGQAPNGICYLVSDEVNKSLVIVIDGNGLVVRSTVVSEPLNIIRMVPTSDGGCIIAGYDCVTKLDALLEVQWSRKFSEDLQNCSIIDIVQGSAGGYVFLGSKKLLYQPYRFSYGVFVTTIDEDGDILGEKTPFIVEETSGEHADYLRLTPVDNGYSFVYHDYMIRLDGSGD